MMAKILPFVYAFAGSLVATLVLTPLVREMNRRLGMVDKPDPRRINKVPIPRGGGLAIVLGVALSYGLFLHFTGLPGIAGMSSTVFTRMSVLAVAVALLGLADDRFSLPPKLKLLGQLVIAALAWGWAGLGFGDLWPSLPAWVDCLMTVFWIVGAVNAFNLIDGLDGLATGLALIATLGMAGGLFFVHDPTSTLFYFAIAGGLLGFLRYNYNPASVFLGDCGSMSIGFVISTLPLASHVPNSFLVSVGVPLLAMGVPIFDTALAILRRSIRHLIMRGEDAGEGQVMTADSDHLHHRLLRKSGLNQRKTAWILYLLALGAVSVGLVAMSLESRSGGLWLAAVSLAAVVIFKDASIELFDAGRLLNRVAHTHDKSARRRLAVWSMPFYVIFDVVALVALFFICAASLGIQLNEHVIRSHLPLRVVAMFFLLASFRVYRTVWSRALGSNYLRLLVACIFGAVAGSVCVYYWPSVSSERLNAITFTYGVASFSLLAGMRMFRGVVRDLFYALDCSRLRNRKDVSRVLVYGAGLRYRAFRRELVRSASANERIIVGILDDDIFLRGKYIGGMKVLGTINDAPEVINALNVDAVVIACEVTDEWMKVIRGVLAPTGVRVSRFNFTEESV